MNDVPKQQILPPYQRPTPPDAVMLDTRVDYLWQWPKEVTNEELRRFITGWRAAKDQPKIETSPTSSSEIKVDGRLYLEYTEWNEWMNQDNTRFSKVLKAEKAKSFLEGHNSGLETRLTEDDAYTRGLSKNIDMLEEIRAKSLAEGEKNGRELKEQDLLAAEKRGSSNGYNLGPKHGRESAWEALGVGPTKEADVAEPHIHEQIDRTTPIAAEGQYVNPGAELARRQKIGQDGKSFDSFADLAEGDSIYDLSKYTAQEGVNDEQEVQDLTDVVEEVATEAVGAESAGIFTDQMLAEQNGIVNDDVEEVVPDGVLKEWFNKGYAAGAQEQDDALEAIKATEEGSVLLDAIAIVQGRRDEYGAAEDSFATIGGYWSVALTQIVGRPVVLSAEDVARMMILLKVARDTEQPKRDNPVDIAGYAGMLQRVRA